MNFKEYKISDLCDVKIGRTPPTSQREWFNPEKDSIDWVSIKDMGECNKYLYNTCKTLSNTAIERFNIPIVEPWRVLLSFKLTIGKVAITTKKCLTNEAIAQFIIKEKNTLDNDFLYYYLINYNFEQLGNTSSIATAINSKIIKMMPIRIPDFSTQKKIAKILSSLDDKIELNNRINKNLEEQAQALFKSWFVDFEPFGGVIPSDWEKGVLSDIADITMGQSPNGSSYNEEGKGKVFFQGRAEFGNRFPTVRLFTTEPKRMAKKNDTLMSVRAPVGDINVAHQDCCIGRGLAAIHSKTKCQSFVLYTMFSLKDKMEVFNGEGTVFGSINRDSLNNISILIPSEEKINEFERIVAPIDSLIRNNYDEICFLQNIRDTLLPKLMSGEIDVDNIQGE